jgi:hypothetical protein
VQGSCQTGSARDRSVAVLDDREHGLDDVVDANKRVHVAPVSADLALLLLRAAVYRIGGQVRELVRKTVMSKSIASRRQSSAVA